MDNPQNGDDKFSPVEIFRKYPIRLSLILTSILALAYTLTIKYVFYSSEKDCCNAICSMMCTACEPPTMQNCEPWITAGTFGDMFGAFNAYFSALAFLGVIYTILLQRKEMENNSSFNKSNLQLTERQWCFNLIPAITEKWHQNKSEHHIEIYSISLILKYIQEPENQEYKKKVINLIKTAKNAFISFNIIPYTLLQSSNFENKDKEDLVYMIYKALDEDLQFCISVLSIKNSLFTKADFLQHSFSPEYSAEMFCKTYTLPPENIEKVKKLLIALKKEVSPNATA